MARAAIYARYSSEMQSSSSARDQVERIKQLAVKGKIATRLYTDYDISVAPEWIQTDEAVTGKIAGRKGYQLIMDGIRKRAFELILVDDLSRLTRSLGNLLDLYQLLKHYDIELVSVSDRLSSADPNSKTFFTVKGMIADFGNDAHAERTIRGLEARARDLFSTGHKPYGYGSAATRKELRKGKEVASHFRITINEDYAEVIRRIFKLYAQGYGRIYIAKFLKQENIPPPIANGKGWKTSTIQRILRNEKYVGQWRFRQITYSIDPDTGRRVAKPRQRHEWIESFREDMRIVPQDLWDKVQERLKENMEIRKKNPSKSHKAIFGSRNRIDNLHLLSGVMQCAECRGAMAVVSGRHEGYYGCLAATRQGSCSNRKIVRRLKIEKAVLDHIDQSIVSDNQVIQYATDTYNTLVKKLLRQSPMRRTQLEDELKRIETELARLIQCIVSGTGSEAILEAIKGRESRKAKINQELARLPQTDERKLLVTPYLVQKRLSDITQTLSERGGQYNGMIREIFDQPLTFKPVDKGADISGMFNIGRAITLGSTQCAVVRPAGLEPATPSLEGLCSIRMSYGRIVGTTKGSGV